MADSSLVGGESPTDPTTGNQVDDRATAPATVSAEDAARTAELQAEEAERARIYAE